MRSIFIITCICVVYFPASAVLAAESSKKGEIILDVPFYPQEEFQCGPAALASVMNFWGRSLQPGEIAADIFSKNARGTLNLDMVLYASGMGFKTLHGKMTLEQIRQNIYSGVPVMVLLDRGFWVVKKGHYVVVAGYSDNAGELIVHDGLQRNRRISEADFLRQWNRSGQWGLVIKERSDGKGAYRQ